MDCPDVTAKWAGDFGNEYTARNRVDWRARMPFWRDVLNLTGARSVHEFGCNAGWNLSAIRRAYPDVVCYGHDVNHRAVARAVVAGLAAGHLNHRFQEEWAGPVCELSFTAGMLIHVPPQQLPEIMAQVAHAGCHHVLAIEYAAEQEEEIPYRGQMGLLWRRPYGKLYEAMGLNLVREWDAGPGFDRCTAWLLEKGETA